MKNLIIVTLLLLGTSVLSVNAQNLFKDGYIVTLKKDTIHGHIGYISENSNYKICYFRKNEVNKMYSPEQIIEYGYGNDKCYSSIIVKGRFVEVLIKGKMSLYKYKDILYVRKGIGEIYKLENIEHEVQIGDGEGVREDSRWKGILSYLTSDFIPDSYEMLDNKYFSEKLITNFIIRYNKCSKSDYIHYENVLPWFKIHVGALAGLSILSYDVPSEITKYSSCEDNYNSFSPMVGLALEMHNPRVSERLSLNTELIFNKVNRSAPDTHYRDPVQWGGVDYVAYSIPFTLKYAIPKRKYTPYIQAGFIYSYMDEGGLNYNALIARTSGVTMLYKRHEFRNSQIGYCGGLGISKSYNKFKICANVRYSIYKMRTTQDFNKREGFSLHNNILDFSIIIYNN